MTKNKKPEPNVEYIYDHTTVWHDKPNHYDVYAGEIKRGSVVEGLKLSNGKYEFNIKGEDGKFFWNLGWAFVENTEKNINILNEINSMRKNKELDDMKIYETSKSLDSLFAWSKK